MAGMRLIWVAGVGMTAVAGLVTCHSQPSKPSDCGLGLFPIGGPGNLQIWGFG